MDIKMYFNNYKFRLVLIKVNSLKMSIDDKIYKLKQYDIDNLYRIIPFIKEKNNTNLVVDPTRFDIEINMEDLKDRIIGNTNTNNNFDMLNDWLGDIYAR